VLMRRARGGEQQARAEARCHARKPRPFRAGTRMLPKRHAKALSIFYGCLSVTAKWFCHGLNSAYTARARFQMSTVVPRIGAARKPEQYMRGIRCARRKVARKNVQAMNIEVYVHLTRGAEQCHATHCLIERWQRTAQKIEN